MKKNNTYIVTILFIICLCISGCEQNDVEQEKNIVETEQVLTNSNEEELYNKGYNLPITENEKTEAEVDCLNKLTMIKGIYKRADNGESSNVVISKNSTIQMMNQLEQSGCPVRSNIYYLNLRNYEKVEKFIRQSQKGEKSEIIIYEVHADGGIGRNKLIFDGKDLYVLYTNAEWNKDIKSVVTNHSFNRIKEWNYTDKGWLHYDYCVPEPPEVTEVVNGNVMIRVKPIREEYREITEKYLLPIGYQGNNLFCSNWNVNHMNELDYNAIFQYLYFVKNQKQYEMESNQEGIPKEDFESIMMEYLPITIEQLQQYAIYDTNKKMYKWNKLKCGNYSPNAFGTSVPEITDISENADGTCNITIDAVCEMLGTDCVMKHQLKVQFLDDGGIKYLSNQIMGDGLNQIPEYQYRIKK